MRTVLYANTKISRFLRKNFILHWKSVRPVPKVTVDFGDGRMIKQTITGNAVHYVLDSQGRLIDAIPGMYAPAKFLNTLVDLQKLWKNLQNANEQKRGNLLVAYHAQELINIYTSWVRRGPKSLKPMHKYYMGRIRTAGEAIRLTVGKRGTEIPMLNFIKDSASIFPEKEMDDEHWRNMAWRYQEDAKLDGSSRKLIALQNPTNTHLNPLIENFEKALAIDTARNEFEFHKNIRQWFCEGAWKDNLENFNKRVYRDIFFTPFEDPWLGLKKDKTYAGLSDNGITLK